MPSEDEVTSAPPKPTQAQPDPWVPQFQIQGNHVTTADSVMQSDSVALAIGRNITMPEDAPLFASGTDKDLANGSLVLGVRATTALSNVCDRLWERKVQIVNLSRQRDKLQEEVFALRDENNGLKRQLKRVRKMREKIAIRLIVSQERKNHKSHIPLPNGHKKSMSF